MRVRVTVLVCLVALGAGVAIGQEGVASTPRLSPAQALSLAIATERYWTPERMAEAQPMPMPTVVVDESAVSTQVTARDLAAMAEAVPGFAPGWRPGQKGAQPDADTAYHYRGQHEYFTGMVANAQPLHGTKPSNPRLGPYGPFQRWTVLDPITTYPKSTIGKLFFTAFGGGSFVCSASVIHRNTLLTAGHCVSDGSGNFHSNFLFCPSYRNGVNPARGCWGWTSATTSTRWHVFGDPDYDYACIVTPPTGTVLMSRIGNVTGWLGRAWNWPYRQQEQTFGYPQGKPFNGNRLITTASPEWYFHNFVAGGQISKIIGSDLTGGSSGGPWIIGWQRPNQEFPDSDGFGVTDPGRDWTNGVNSHKRCRIDCRTPPTNTNGVYWQEMTSPPFRRTAADNGESEDIFAVCFGNGGTTR